MISLVQAFKDHFLSLFVLAVIRATIAKFFLLVAGIKLIADGLLA